MGKRHRSCDDADVGNERAKSARNLEALIVMTSNDTVFATVDSAPVSR